MVGLAVAVIRKHCKGCGDSVIMQVYESNVEHPYFSFSIRLRDANYAADDLSHLIIIRF